MAVQTLSQIIIKRTGLTLKTKYLKEKEGIQKMTAVRGEFTLERLQKHRKVRILPENHELKNKQTNEL